jgi:hypothetical protein
MANLFAAYSRYLDITHTTGYTEYSLMQRLDQAGYEQHRIVYPHVPFNRSNWRAWFALRLYNGFHRLMYRMRQGIQPTCHDRNIEMYSVRPT